MTPPPAARPLRRFLTIPWIAQRGDALTAQLAEPGRIELTPLRLHDAGDAAQRHALNHLARRCPTRFACYVETRLLATPGPCHGLLLTHDWPAPMRIAAQVARAHGLPVFLAPHEAFFVELARYYRDPWTGIDVPQADLTFVWGHLQQEIFVDRGYPVERTVVVGSPKLAACAAARPPGPAALRARLGAPADRPLVSYVAQPLDNLGDTRGARARQAAAVAELAALCAAEGWTLALRLPPGGEGLGLITPGGGAAAGPQVRVVDPDRDGIDPLDQLGGSDLVVGYSSTMLLEAMILGRPTVIYAAGLPVTLWEDRLGLPVARDPAALAQAARAALARGEPGVDAARWRWIAWAFSDGVLQGGDPVARIRDRLVAAAPVPVALAGRARRFGVGPFPDLDPGIPRLALRLTAAAMARRARRRAAV